MSNIIHEQGYRASNDGRICYRGGPIDRCATWTRTGHVLFLRTRDKYLMSDVIERWVVVLRSSGRIVVIVLPLRLVVRRLVGLLVLV